MEQLRGELKQYWTLFRIILIMKLFLALFAIFVAGTSSAAIKMKTIQKGQINEGSQQQQLQVAKEGVKKREKFDAFDRSQYLHDHQNNAKHQASPKIGTLEPLLLGNKQQTRDKKDNGRLSDKMWMQEKDDQRSKRNTFELQSTNKDKLSTNRINNQQKPYRFGNKINLKPYHYKRKTGGQRRGINIIRIEADTQQGNNIIRICEDLKDLKAKTLMRKRELLQSSRSQKINQGKASSKQQDIAFYCLLALLSIFAAIPLLSMIFSRKTTPSNTSESIREEPNIEKSEQLLEKQHVLS